MRTYKYTCAILFLLATGVHAAELPDAEFAKVKDGALAVYSVFDLTGGKQELADRIGRLIRETVCPDDWTTNGGTAAAMRVTPDHVTIKSGDDARTQVKALLAKLREAPALCFRVDYRVIDCASLKPEPLSDSELSPLNLRRPRNKVLDRVDPNRLPTDAKEVLSASQITVRNGAMAQWIDGAGIGLPTIDANWTRSTTVGAISVQIDRAAPDARPDVYWMPLGGSSAYPLDDKRTRWLIFTVNEVNVPSVPVYR